MPTDLQDSFIQGGDPSVDDSAVIILEFENGVRGVLHFAPQASGQTTFGQTHQMEFQGSAGTLDSFADWDKTQSVSGAGWGRRDP
jgi:predicted dehydrogenase